MSCTSLFIGRKGLAGVWLENSRIDMAPCRCNTVSLKSRLHITFAKNVDSGRSQIKRPAPALYVSPLRRHGRATHPHPSHALPAHATSFRLSEFESQESRSPLTCIFVDPKRLVHVPRWCVHIQEFPSLSPALVKASPEISQDPSIVRTTIMFTVN